MYCKNCGKELKDGSNFCPYCGKTIPQGSDARASAQLSAQQTQPSAPPKEAKGSRGLLIGLAVIAVLLLAAIVLLLLSSRNSTEENASTAEAAVSETEEAEIEADTNTQSKQNKTSVISAEAEKEATHVQYQITAVPGFGGSIEPSGTTYVEEGEDLHVYILPDEGYEIAEVLINGEYYGTDSSFKFSNVSNDVIISASFVRTAAVSYYEVTQNNITWKSARSIAEKSGGHLATVTSQEEFDYLVSEAWAQGIHILYVGGRVDWSGSGAPLWTNGEDFTYHNWLSGEPNDWDGTEDYLCIMRDASSGKWGFADIPNNTPDYYEGKAIIGYAIEWEE